jgi:hypothetical protein
VKTNQIKCTLDLDILRHIRPNQLQKNLEYWNQTKFGVSSEIPSSCQVIFPIDRNTNKTNSVALVRKRTTPTERPPLVGEVRAKFADRGCCVFSAMDPHGRILGFLDQSSYFSIQVAPQLSSRGWVDPVPDPLLLRLSGSAGNRTRDLWICSQELWPLDHRGRNTLHLTMFSQINYSGNA